MRSFGSISLLGSTIGMCETNTFGLAVRGSTRAFAHEARFEPMVAESCRACSVKESGGAPILFSVKLGRGVPAAAPMLGKKIAAVSVTRNFLMGVSETFLIREQSCLRAEIS